MSTLTSSVINKTGKTVAPKAVARRRPAAARTAPPPPPASGPGPDATPGTSAEVSTHVSGPGVVPQSAASEAPSAGPEDGRSSQPEHPSRDVTNDISRTQHVALATPPPTQAAQGPQPSQVVQVPPPTQEEERTPASIIAASTEHATQAGRTIGSEASQVDRTAQEQYLHGDRVEISDFDTRGTSLDESVPREIIDPASSIQAPVAYNEVGVAPARASRARAVAPVSGVKRKRNAAKVTAQPQESTDRPRDESQDANSSGVQPTIEGQGPTRNQEDETAGTEQSISQRQQANAKPKRTRKKKQAVEVPTSATIQDGGNATTADGTQKPAKKAKTKRKPLSAARVVEDDEDNIGGAARFEAAVGADAQQDETVARETAPKRKKRKQPTGQDGSAQDDAAPKKKRKPSKKAQAQALARLEDEQRSRQPAEGEEEDADVEDPELHEIDPQTMTLSMLTSDRKHGKTSELEAKMATIDWAEVVRKRREAPTPAADAEANEQTGQGGQTEGDEEPPDQTPRPQAHHRGMQVRIANGELVIDEALMHIDRQAQVALANQNVTVEENMDLTKRTNRMTWINDKKRDPADRVSIYKLKSDPWNDDETDRFYDALRMFGTDFFIISKMFPPKTRRQIKLKFVREERIDPARINAALAGQGVPMDLGAYAEAAGEDPESFRDPKELEEELKIAGDAQRTIIEQKRKETAESREQHDIQVASRERDRAEREAQKQAEKEQRAAVRLRKKKGLWGTGTM